MDFLEQIKNSTIAWIILSLITILSLLWAIYSHFSNKKRKEFSIAFSSCEIIKSGKATIPGLEFIFHGKQIVNLTISKIAIWNSGNEVINLNDMVATEKLEIIASNKTEILEAQIVTETEKANSFRISSFSEKNVCIDFDYVNSHEGIVVQILHTGQKEPQSLNVKCKIKGGYPIKNYSSIADSVQKRIVSRFFENGIFRKTFSLTMILYSIFIFFISLISIYGVIMNPYDLIATDNILLRILLIGFFGILSIATFISFIEYTKSTFNIGVPSKLKTYTVYSDDMFY